MSDLLYSPSSKQSRNGEWMAHSIISVLGEWTSVANGLLSRVSQTPVLLVRAEFVAVLLVSSARYMSE